MSTRTRAAAVLLCAAAVASTLACRSASSRSSQPTFASPDEAVKALIEVAKSGKPDRPKTAGPKYQPMSPFRTVDRTSASGGLCRCSRRGVAAREDGADRRSSSATNRGRFRRLVKDRTGGCGAAGSLRPGLGRNGGAIRLPHLTSAGLCQTRDGKPWPVTRRSSCDRPANGCTGPRRRGAAPGDLIADASDEGKSPFHGYHFRCWSRGRNGFASSRGRRLRRHHDYHQRGRRRCQQDLGPAPGRRQRITFTARHQVGHRPVTPAEVPDTKH